MSQGARVPDYARPRFFLGAFSSDSSSVSPPLRFLLEPAFFAFTSALRAASPSSSSSSDAKSLAALAFLGTSFFFPFEPDEETGFPAFLLGGFATSSFPSSLDANGSSAPAFFFSFGFSLVVALLSAFLAAASSAATVFAVFSSAKYSSLSAWGACETGWRICGQCGSQCVP